MFRQPIVSRCVDGVARICAFHRPSSAAGDSCGALAKFQRRVEALLNTLCPGSHVMNVIATNTCDEKEGLGMLARAIDLDRCDVLVVESLDRLSRDPRQLNGFLCGLEQGGVRLVALDDGFDSAVDDLPEAIAIALAGNSIVSGTALITGSS